MVFILFRFGAWDRVAYNNTKAVAPLYVYVYSKKPVVVNGKKCLWGLCDVIGKKGDTDTKKITIEVNGKKYVLVIPLVREIKEEKEKKKPTILLEIARTWLKENAQQAAFISGFAILFAYGWKKKTMLLRPWSGFNIVLLIVSCSVIYVVFKIIRPGSEWLWLVFAVSEFLTWLVVPVGRKVRLAFEDYPSRCRVEKEVLLYSVHGKWAIAEQSTSAALRRLRGKHTLILDSRLGEPGKLDESSFWEVYNEDYDYEFKELRLLDAVKTKVKVER